MPVSNNYCPIHGCALEDTGKCTICDEEGRAEMRHEAEWQERTI